MTGLKMQKTKIAERIVSALNEGSASLKSEIQALELRIKRYEQKCKVAKEEHDPELAKEVQGQITKAKAQLNSKKRDLVDALNKSLPE